MVRIVATSLVSTCLLAVGVGGANGDDGVVKQCGDEWRAAKSAGSVYDETWAEFLADCRIRRERATAPGAVSPSPKSWKDQCGDDWKAAKAAGATYGENWSVYLRACQARRARTPAPTAPTALAAAPTPIAAAPEPAAPPSPAVDGIRRVALVIGNGAYKNAALANPTVDADLVGASLARVGFDVTVMKNVDFAGFDDALTAFVAREEGADVAVFYFAGHGFAIPGDDLRPRNYLMATSADMSAKSDAVLRRDGLTIDEVVNRISGHAKATLAFVDACRDDPFHRGGGRGFEPVAVPLSRQLYIGMSTQIGKTALDGDAGAGSPFARAFAEQVTTPGLRIDDAFRAIRREVARSTDGKQQPEVLQDELDKGAVVLSKVK